MKEKIKNIELKLIQLGNDLEELKKQSDVKEEEKDPYLIEGCVVEFTRVSDEEKWVDILESETKEEYLCKKNNYYKSLYNIKVIGTVWDHAPDWAEYATISINNEIIVFYGEKPILSANYIIHKRPSWAVRK